MSSERVAAVLLALLVAAGILLNLTDIRNPASLMADASEDALVSTLITQASQRGETASAHAGYVASPALRFELSLE